MSQRAAPQAVETSVPKAGPARTEFERAIALHREGKVAAAEKAGKQSILGVGALKCFSFTGTSSSAIVFPSSSAKMTASFAANPFSSQAASPPFRPPRI